MNITVTAQDNLTDKIVIKNSRDEVTARATFTVVEVHDTDELTYRVIDHLTRGRFLVKGYRDPVVALISDRLIARARA